MEATNIIYLLTGFSVGMILTAFGYHKWFVNYNNTINDLKSRLRDKNLIIKSLTNYYETSKDETSK